jgi:hypothetical protein
MKRALIVLVVALPLMADEPKSDNKEKTSPATTTTAAAAPAAQPDSPLVAAAKRANRKGRKSTAILITNENLKTSGANAHVTSTTNSATIQMPKPLEPPRPTPEMEHARQQAEHQKQVAEQEAKVRKVKEEKERAAQQAAAAAEEGYDGMQDDAGEFVGANPPPPQF